MVNHCFGFSCTTDISI